MFHLEIDSIKKKYFIYKNYAELKAQNLIEGGTAQESKCEFKFLYDENNGGYIVLSNLVFLLLILILF